MALDTQAGNAAPDQNGAQCAPVVENDPAEQTAIEEASVIHLLRVLVAEAAPPAKVPPDDAMEHDPPSADQAQEINDVTCEEAGCLLWDMSASRPVARVMLRNRALEALEVVIARELQIVQSPDDPEAAAAWPPEPAAAAAADDGDGGGDGGGGGCASPEGGEHTTQQQQRRRRRSAQNALRILEICLGTLANLIVTQPAAATSVSGRPELLALMLGDAEEAGASSQGGGALYVDDARVLSELFRLFSLALRCQGSAAWLAALSSPAVLQRVMWVGAATADTQLFARFLDMLVALLHATCGAEEAAAGSEEEGGGGGGGIRQPAEEGDAAAGGGAADRPSGADCSCVLLGCGLLELLHGVLLQALRGCMPAEEKYGELGGGDGGGDEYGSPAVSDRQLAGGDSPPSVESGSADAAGASGRREVAAAATGVGAGGEAAEGDSRDEAAGAGMAAEAEGTPSRSDWHGGQQGAAAAAAAAAVLDTRVEGPSRGGDEGGIGGGGGAEGAAARGDVAAAAAAASAAAATAAAAAAGPVPLSDEAVDAALRLIEELVSPSGPLVAAPDGGGDAAAVADSGGGAPTAAVAAIAAAAGGRSGAEVLLQLYAQRDLRPGLLQLLLGLLRYQYDSMQVLEGLLVVLVDLGPAVQQAVALSTPEQVAAVASRLVELLQDSCYSPADGAPSSVVQLQQGAWYLLAATLRGGLEAAAAASAEDAVAAAAAAAAGRAHWPALERCLAVVPELPRPEGCRGYVRAVCLAGLRLMEQQQQSPAAAAVGEVRSGGERGGGAAGGTDQQQRQTAGGSAAAAGAAAAALENGQRGGMVGSGREEEAESLARLAAELRSVVSSLDGEQQVVGAE